MNINDHWGTYLGCLSKLISHGYSKYNQLLIQQFLGRDGRRVLDESVSCCLGGYRENSVAAGDTFSIKRTRKGSSAARAEMKQMHSEDQRGERKCIMLALESLSHNLWTPLHTPCIFTTNFSSYLYQLDGFL